MPAAQQPLVRVRGLTKSYGDTQALRGIDLELPEGVLFGLLGPNGSGKTSTLECLLGLRKPDAGQIQIAGIDALAFPGRARSLTGALIQGTQLQGNITPCEALQLWAAFHGVACKPVEVLAQVGLEAKAKARFDTLSTGQKQRLMLALAVLHRPRLLLLDEPCAGLDPAAREDFHRRLQGLRKEGCTILLSTHDLADTALHCDQIAILNEGRVVAQGVPEALFKEHGIGPRTQVQVAPPSLAELFLKLTGKEWQDSRARGVLP